MISGQVLLGGSQLINGSVLGGRDTLADLRFSDMVWTRTRTFRRFVPGFS